MERRHKFAVIAGGAMLLVVILCVSIYFAVKSVGSESSGLSEEKETSKVDFARSSCEGVSGGTSVKSRKDPWLVTLSIPSKKVTCAGTLISPAYVVTAASCVPRDMVYDTGMTHTAEKIIAKAENSATTVNVLGGFVHVGYNPSRHHPFQDIALFRLQQPLSSLKSACLPASNQHAPPKCQLRSLGMTDPADPKSIPTTAEAYDLNVFQYTQCTNFKTLNKTYAPFLDESVICVNSPPDKRGVCFGDSGAPVMCRTLDKDGHAMDAYHVFGVVSQVPAKSPCGVKPGYVTTATNVAFFRPWIVNVAKEVLDDPGAAKVLLACVLRWCQREVQQTALKGPAQSYACRLFAAYVLCERHEKRPAWCQAYVVPNFIVRGSGVKPVNLNRQQIKDVFEKMVDHMATEC